ncbi:autophagy-related protein 22-like protein [Fomitopsis serialis]|uniref:autophagy-related protein 22-like protein n=1 Tax=Fomitopsis serialis TaxID=139415 RepID=UPI002007580E|nr:autophagy-related protein 22-like protein [Neoantrodia serialis]KAH9921430.1 autophagy-related protein 22-like protein [Neoantrodia serialis]
MSQPMRVETVTSVRDPNGVEVNNLSKSSDMEVEVVAVTPMKREEPVVTRKELWSYYLYYNGDNGVGPIIYFLTLFQSQATSAGWDPSQGPGSTCTNSEQCVLPWGSGTKSVSSVVLIANGLSFAVHHAILFTTISSAADYSTFGRWLLLVVTVIGWAAQFASMALTKPSRWEAAMALYILSYVSYGATLLENREISREEYELEESLEKNRVSNISAWHSNIGFIFVLCLNLSVLLPLANNALVDNYTIVLTNMYGVILSAWWFIFQQPRPGPPLPPGEHYLTIGWKQIWLVLRQWRKLPYTFMYLFAFFLYLIVGLNTTGTLISICQNDHTYLSFAQAFTATASTIGFWWIQRYWKISTKKMFMATNVFTILIPVWGMIGLWTTRFGFHQVWEYWAWNAVFGLFQAPYYSYSQTMMAELAPPGFDNMFFGLFGLSNRASSIIGPNVIQAIINRTQNNWEGFPFLVAICTAASLVIWFGVDVEKGRRDAVAWAEQNRPYAETGVRVKGDASESLDSGNYEKKP